MAEESKTDELPGTPAEDAEETRPAVRDEGRVADIRVPRPTAVRELQAVFEKLRTTTAERLRPAPPDTNAGESYADAVEGARERIADGSPEALEVERVRHAGGLAALDLAGRLRASFKYGTDSWERMAAEVGAGFWVEVRELVAGIYESLAAGDAAMPMAFNAALTEEQDAATWWLQTAGDLSIQQFVAAMALGRGRPEDEIGEVLGIKRHHLHFWRQTIPQFGQMVEFWERTWNDRARGMEQRTIDTFAEHDDPTLQEKAVGMVNQRRRTEDSERRTEIAEGALHATTQRDAFQRKMTEEHGVPAIQEHIRALRESGQLARKGHRRQLMAPAVDIIDVEAEAEDEVPDADGDVDA